MQPPQILTKVLFLDQMSAVLQVRIIYAFYNSMPLSSSNTEMAWQHPDNQTRLFRISLLQHHSSLYLTSHGVQFHI